MANFQNPFFRSNDPSIEEFYSNGVVCLNAGDPHGASDNFVKAAKGKHTSAFFNLCLLWGSGMVTPYNFDGAAECCFWAAEQGHPTAQKFRKVIEFADKGELGVDNLTMFIQKEGSAQGLVAFIMISAARYFDVLCRKYGATNDVISYELDAATQSDWSFIHSFVKRTGINKSVYDGGLNRLTTGSAADQITDALNQFTIAMRQAGFSNEIAIMARCSIVGYIISKSPYAEQAKELYGTDRFFMS